MCEPEYSLNLLHRKHPFYVFFLKAYSIAFFFLFAIWHCLLLAKACCCKVRINDKSQAESCCSIRVPRFHSLGVLSKHNFECEQSTSSMQSITRLLLYQTLIAGCLLSYASGFVSCHVTRNRILQAAFAFEECYVFLRLSFPAPQCLPLQLLSHSLMLLSATYFVTRLLFLCVPIISFML